MHLLEEAAYVQAADNIGALEAQSETSWEKPPVRNQYSTSSIANFYLYNFISVIQGGPKEWR